MPRSILNAAIVLLALAIHADAATAAQADAKPSVFTIAFYAGLPDLDPSTAASVEQVLLANVYEPLVWFQPGKGAQPGLAERWEASSDGKQWTFYLRKGVKFHDGTPFDAEAVKFSIERTQKLNGSFAYIWQGVNKIEAKDPYTVVMMLDYPQPLDLIAAATYSAWMISPAAADKDGQWFNAGHDAGTGPYRIESYQPSERAVLTRFDGYWGGWKDGQFGKAVFEIVDDATLRQQKIESGEADWTYLLPVENLAALDARSDVKVVVNPSFQNWYAHINIQKKPLDNVKVRQALSYSFPYQDVIASVMQGQAGQSFGIIPQGIPAYDPQARQYTYDLAKAKALLAEAGLPNGGFELTATIVTGVTVAQHIGELWQASLAKLGITLKLQPMAYEALLTLARRDPDKAQDLMVFAWWPTIATPYDYLKSIFHTEPKPDWNFSYYSNPAFDKLIEEAYAKSGVDWPSAEKLFREANRILIEEAPAIFIFDQPNRHIIRENIKGYVDNPAYSYVVFVYQLSR
ncbi:MAG: ABC transporter substrate-binding protein [Gammaproteobacteria bacterium]